MASSGADEVRLTRLSKLFNEVLYGRRSLSTARDGKLFIEALCGQPDPPACAHKLISSPSGLSSLQASVRFDTSAPALNESGLMLLRYIQDPSLETINAGSVLAQIIRVIVEPPFFWDALTNTFRDGMLNRSASQAYAWLLLQLIRLSGTTSTTYLMLARSSEILNPILKSPDGETRILGQKIQYELSFELSGIPSGAEAKPGGRHGNDFEDIRQISIMPSGDELLSQERPFLRIADDYIEDPQLASSRLPIHMDNLFRLLREDMIGELREELRILTGTKRGRHRGLIVDELRLTGVELGYERKRQPWGIRLQCKKELPPLAKVEPSKRKAYLLDNRQILRNQNMACLLVDDEVVAFPTIQRNEGDLAKIPATIILQLQDDSSTTYALSKLKVAERIKLVQLDTAIFAFEPFLKRLQEIKELPLAEELLHWEVGKILRSPKFQPVGVIQKLKHNSGKELKAILGTQRSVCLDDSQTDSVCISLSQRVSLVQGPPGKRLSHVHPLPIAKCLTRYWKIIHRGTHRKDSL
jgi:hypothetical protein